MAITYSLVKLMDGKIEVNSKPERGSQFVVTLPLQIAETQIPDDAQSNSKDGVSLHGHNILIAEDNEINRLVIEAMLEDTHATLHFAHNGVEAVDTFSTLGPEIVLMDIQMPEMDGVEACKLIKQIQPNVPIIALTANAMAQDIKLYEQVGFDDYLAKPVEVEVLMQTLGKYLNPSVQAEQHS